MEKNKVIGISIGAAALIYLITQKHSSPDNNSTPVKLSPSQFYKKYYSAAVSDQKKTGVPALFTLAQAALESYYGLRSYGNNFFGIKANKSWTGPTQQLLTWESGATGNPVKDGISDQIIKIYKPGEPGGIYKNSYSYRVRSNFRKYNSPEEGFADHSNFLKTNSRYKDAFKYSDPKQFAQAVANAGYATDPNYASSLIKLIIADQTPGTLTGDRYMQALSGFINEAANFT